MVGITQSLASMGIANFDLLSVSSAGIMSNPTQPSVLVKTGASDDCTGDGTTVTLTTDTEYWDTQGEWDGTSTYTAEGDGYRLVIVTPPLLGVGSGHTDIIISALSSNRTQGVRHAGDEFAKAGGFEDLRPGWPFVVYMDDNDTLTLTVRVLGGAKTCDLNDDGAGLISIDMMH